MASGCEFAFFSFQLVLSDQMYSGIAQEKITLSKMSCAAICAGRGSCSSFFYKRYERNCFLLDVNITDHHHKMSPTLGMRQYKKISSGFQPPSTANGRDSAADRDGKQRQVSGGFQSLPTATVRDSAADHDGKHHQVSGGFRPPSTANGRVSAADRDGKQRQVSGNGCPRRHDVPYVYHAKGNFCYQDRTHSNVNFDGAKSVCHRAGGILMKADTVEKHRLFVSAAENRPNVKTLWVGGWTTASKKKWMWADMTPIVNDYWGEKGADLWPTNNCLSYAWSQNGFKWDDVMCISSKGFFCEAPVEDQS